MTRLVDELLVQPPRLAAGGYNPPTEIRDNVLGTLHRQLEECEVFLIDNVAEYWSANGGWSKPMRPGDFPNVAPPFSQFFMEHSIRDEHGRVAERDARAGFLFMVIKEDPEAGWTIEICPYLGGPGGPVGPIDVLYLVVDGSGRVLDLRGPKSDVQDRPDDMVSGHWRLVAPALLAVCFLHCRNVRTEVIAPDAKVNRARARRGKRPLRRYKVLRIEPMTTTLTTEGGIEDAGLAKALHICRGHFKAYEERPLFGRLRGTWWWQDHVRGAIEAGVVEKDYLVDSPAAALSDVQASAARQAGPRRSS